MIYDILILGAGAAGLFAGASLSPAGSPYSLRTLLLDRNPSPGKKLLLAGNGQCNLTHQGDVREFLRCYGPNGKRLRPVLFPFSNQAVMKFFQNRGIPLTLREDGKVFPRSLQGRDVLDALVGACRENGLELRFSTPVTGLLPPQEEDAQGLWTVLSGDRSLRARRVIVAAGGCSHPATGSDGSLFPLLSRLGIPLVPVRPALAPVFVQDYPFSDLAGISFPDARLTLIPAGARGSGVELCGPVLLTHTGFSGPAVLALSRYVRPGDRLRIAWNARWREEEVAAFLRPKETSQAGRPSAAAAVARESSLPKRFAERLCALSGLSPDKKIDQLSKKESRSLAEHLLRTEFSISGTAGFAGAMVTAGGVSLEDVNLKTMESLRFPGLYFAGEILDVDGDTGGYNLQFAFSSGRLAALSAARSLFPSPKPLPTQ